MKTEEHQDENKLVGGMLSLARQAGQGLSPARAALARLKRALSDDGVAPSALREIGHLLRQDMTRQQMENHLLLAALFAHHPTQGNNRMGRAMQLLRKDSSASIDARITALIEAPREELPYRLRQIVQLLESKGIALNWYDLLIDLDQWGHRDRFVQARWARECFVPSFSSAPTPES